MTGPEDSTGSTPGVDLGKGRHEGPATQPAADGDDVSAGADPAPAAATGAAAASSEPAAPGGAVGAPRPGRAKRALQRAALLLVPVLLAGACAVLLDRVRDADTVASYYRPSSPPLEAARTASRVLFSYDHRRLDADFAAGAALSTGDFREEYARTTAAVVREVAERYDAVVVAEPVVAGVASADPGRVTAVVYLDQSTTSTETQGPQVDTSRVRMTLVERDGEWLVSAVEAL